ncbi:MAG: FAD:protein FMN transferase [Clostridia bacterium]|nr:FAD:protein FMN transferase [Clostridia bacterium]
MKKFFNSLLIALCVMLVGALAGCTKQAETTHFAMDTVITIKLKGKEANGAMSDIIACLDGFEAEMSMFKEGSLVKAVNDNAGKQPVQVSEGAYALIKRALELCNSCGGRFDITIGPLTTAWDITGDNPQIPHITEELLALINYNDVVLNDGDLSVMLKKEGQQIDLGGIAKGAACDRCLAILKEKQIDEGIISIGGNVIVYGGRSFKVGIKHPRNDGELIATVNVTDKIVSTTGDYERYFEVDGKRYHHIFDHNTGMPYESDFYSVTVISEDGALADFLSTLAFMTKKEDIAPYLEQYSVIAFGKDGNVYMSKNLDFTLLDTAFKVYGE